MITTLVFLCLSVLDFQHPPKPDNPFKNFVVNNSLDNSAMTGCTMNPSAGGPSNHFIEIDFVNNNDPYEGESSASRFAASFDDAAIPTSMEITSMRPPVEPGLPDPDPNPPVAATPEPPTLAILTISGIVLLFLLFGRRKKERLYRRS